MLFNRTTTSAANNLATSLGLQIYGVGLLLFISLTRLDCLRKVQYVSRCERYQRYHVSLIRKIKNFKNVFFQNLSMEIYHLYDNPLILAISDLLRHYYYFIDDGYYQNDRVERYK